MSQPRERIYLIDGLQMLYRAHFALISRPLTRSDGLTTSAAYGTAEMLRSLIAQHGCERIGFIMDDGHSGRTEIYPEYKATRTPMPDELRACIPYALRLIEALGVPVIRYPGHEADDVIGTLACQAAEAGLEAVILSKDKDFLQLIREGILIMHPGNTQSKPPVPPHFIDAAVATERLGVPPELTCDYLALIGDSSDNIPGARNVGPKTAVTLLTRHGDMEGVLRAAKEGKIPGKRGSVLVEDADLVRLSKRLVTFFCDLPVPVQVQEIRRKSGGARALTALLEELEFPSLIEQWGLQRFVGLSPEAGAPVGEANITAPLPEALSESDLALPQVLADDSEETRRVATAQMSFF